MAPQPSTRNEQSRVHERPPDPAEATRTPLVANRPHDPRAGEDPKHRFSHQADEIDPTSDSDPYADAESGAAAEDGPALEAAPAGGESDLTWAAGIDDPGNSAIVDPAVAAAADPDRDPEMLAAGEDDVRPPADS